MYNPEENNKLFIIEISNFCLNKCDGCIYTASQRKNNFFMGMNDFEKVINFIYEYCIHSKLKPHILLGTGEVINEHLKEYVFLIEKKFKNIKKTIEIATTGKIENFKEIILDIRKGIEDIKKTNLLIEFVLDGVEKNNDSKKLINKNIKICKDNQIEYHTILKISKNYDVNKELIINNINSYDIETIALDYSFLNNTKKVLDFNETTDFFLNFDNLLKNKSKVKIVNYLQDINENDYFLNEGEETEVIEENNGVVKDNILRRNFGFYITTKLDLEPILELPLGDIIINKLNTNFSLDINLNQDLSINLNKIKSLEKKTLLLNRLYVQKIDMCNSCSNNKNCNIFFVKHLMDYNNIEFKDDCLGGYKILKHFESEEYY